MPFEHVHEHVHEHVDVYDHVYVYAYVYDYVKDVRGASFAGNNSIFKALKFRIEVTI